MAAVEVPQTLEYKGGQLNVAPVLEVENFTNWKKRLMCHIIGIEFQFKNIISNGPYIPMAVGQRKPETQWTPEERKYANLDQYKALMNELVNDGIKLSKLEINTGFINGLPKKWLAFCQSLRNINHVKESEDSQDSPDDEEDIKSSQEYMNDLEEEYQARAPLAKSKRFFKKGLIVESYDWDEEEVSSDDNEVPEVKALMALADEERVSVSKESARNVEWIKISMKMVHTLLEMEDNDDIKSFLD
ncbi:hypothetical protein Tco_1489155, partial [Tanacetum coccineum]